MSVRKAIGYCEGSGGPQIGEVTCVGSPHLSCKHDQIKMRDYMNRRVTPPKRVTSPTWGPPQALKLGRNCDNSRNNRQLNFYLNRDDSSGTH